MNRKLSLGIFVILTLSLWEVDGHGMVLSPAGRGSRWRFNATAPKDYDDNGANCGGRDVQHLNFGGKCGICGDVYGEKTPRDHEIGGKYGEGVITGTFQQGEPINVTVKITANHFGHFVFDICNLDGEIESEECFSKEILTVDGDHFNLTKSEIGLYYVDLQLPGDVICEHCVLRFTYVTGNSWGVCEDGSGQTGCGPQENFRSCSDIKILPQSHVPENFNDRLEDSSETSLDDDVKINTSMSETPQQILKDLSVLLKALKSHLEKIDSAFNGNVDDL